MRCNSCNKFVSYSDTPDIEIDTESIEDTEISTDITVYLTCAECGDQLKQANPGLTFDFDGTHTCDPTAEVHEFNGEQYTFYDSSAEGNRLKDGWQATLNFTIHCARCALTFDADTTLDIPTSEFGGLTNRCPPPRATSTYI
jgi:hypothetical protein